MIHDGEFREVLKDADEKYQSKKAKYGDSWKTMWLVDLDKRLMQEVEECVNAVNVGAKYDELLDIINIAMMFAQRLRRNGKSGGLS